MRTWFTADLHLGHEAIIKHQPETRPFTSMEEMENTIIGNINELVKPEDMLYILGDFCWKNSRVNHYRSRIKCKRIILIKGNHEPKGNDKLRTAFSEVYDLRKIKVGEQEIVLCHYAMRVWNKSHRGVWHLYGHSHGSLADWPDSLSMDVGIDCHNLKPISFEEVRERMWKKNWKPIDHHGDENHRGYTDS